MTQTILQPTDAACRRQFLQSAACGFGWLAWSALANEQAVAMEQRPVPVPLFAPRAKRVIFLFMQGGPSQVDTFDYKPRLEWDNGKRLPFDDARIIANSGRRDSSQRVMKSPWKFARHGKCGRHVSELFPHQARCVDDLCFLHSVHTEGVAHGPATLFLHCGATSLVRPSIGSWISYGLGTENANLPAFVSIAPAAGNGGPRNFGQAFLPALYQGTALGRAGAPASTATIRNLHNPRLSTKDQRRQLELIKQLNAEQRKSMSHDSEIDALVASYELAWRLETRVPHVLDLSRESRATHALYGIDQEPTADFGRKCLLARRLCEGGVRYVQVTYGDNTANPAWDQHSNLPKHADHARAVDKPIAGLLQDLKQRGLLDDTVVWWGSEFGRTPYAQNNGTGRDHNPDGFTMWLAGGGVKAGFAHGATDEFGHQAVTDRIHMHDMHATLLHLLGLDHQKLTFRYGGRDFRLTDVHGKVVQQILA